MKPGTGSMACAAALVVAVWSWWWVIGSAPPALPPARPDAVRAAAPSRDDGECRERLRLDGAGALDFALAWEARGGGDGARRCAALAIVAGGEPERGAARLEALGGRPGAGDAARATWLGEAGQAWMLAGQPRRALGAITLALSLAPEDAGLLVDRAAASGALGRFGDALEDAGRAAALEPGRVEAWVFRAAALRRLERTGEALEDVARALAIDPGHAAALLERGILRRMAGDAEGAREDWEAVLAREPEGGAAAVARRNLELDQAPRRRS